MNLKISVSRNPFWCFPEGLLGELGPQDGRRFVLSHGGVLWLKLFVAVSKTEPISRNDYTQCTFNANFENHHSVLSSSSRIVAKKQTPEAWCHRSRRIVKYTLSTPIPIRSLCTQRSAQYIEIHLNIKGIKDSVASPFCHPYSFTGQMWPSPHQSKDKRSRIN